MNEVEKFKFKQKLRHVFQGEVGYIDRLLKSIEKSMNDDSYVPDVHFINPSFADGSAVEIILESCDIMAMIRYKVNLIVERYTEISPIQFTFFASVTDLKSRESIFRKQVMGEDINDVCAYLESGTVVDDLVSEMLGKMMLKSLRRTQKIQRDMYAKIKKDCDWIGGDDNE